MGLVLAFAVLVAWVLIINEIKIRKWIKAFELHNDMFNKYVELCDDSLMTDNKWKEWLPIFEEADRIFARDCPDMKLDPISSRVRNILKDEESIQD